jgi:hypothetical protein
MLARLEARQGNLENAEALARDALERGSEMEYPNLEAATLAALAEVLELGGNGGDAASVATAALERYEAKGNTVAAARLREAFEAPP